MKMTSPVLRHPFYPAHHVRRATTEPTDRPTDRSRVARGLAPLIYNPRSELHRSIDRAPVTAHHSSATRASSRRRIRSTRARRRNHRHDDAYTNTRNERTKRVHDRSSTTWVKKRAVRRAQCIIASTREPRGGTRAVRTRATRAIIHLCVPSFATKTRGRSAPSHRSPS